MNRSLTVGWAFTLVFTACGDTASTEVTTPIPEDAGAPVEEVRLSDYVPVWSGEPDEEWIAQERQAQEFTATCMAEQGFEYIPWVPAAMDPGYVDWQATEEERRATEGFGMAYYLLFEPDEEYYADEPPDPNHAIWEALAEPEREAYDYALWGEQPDESDFMDFDWETATEEELTAAEEEMERRWREREWTGCMEFGWEEASGQSDELWMSFDEAFDPWEEIDRRIQADPRAIALEEGWVTCMGDAGFTFTDQEDMYRTLNEEFERIVTWPGEEPGEGGMYTETTVAFEGPELEPIEHPDGTVTFVDPDGNVYTEEEAEELWAELEEQWEPTFDEAELQAFLEREVVVAVADWECTEGFWEAMAELWEEYQDRWATENKTALDAWKAEFEANR